MTVTCVDDNPVAVNDSATVNEDASATAVPVLTNDTDIDGGPKTISSITQPTNGTVVGTGGSSGAWHRPDLPAQRQLLQRRQPDRQLHLHPATAARQATVSMTVTCVDDTPVAVNDSATVVEDANATAVNVLANDTDIDGGPKTIASIAQPANGTVVGHGRLLRGMDRPDLPAERQLLQRRPAPPTTSPTR